MTERQLQAAVARADLIVCAMLRWAVALLLLAGILLICVIAAHGFLARAGPDPDVIDYDVTSEGPDGYTAAWYEWEKEE